MSDTGEALGKQITKLKEVQKELRNIRDNQKEIPCKDDDCMCKYFDFIIDLIEDAIMEMEDLGDEFDLAVEKEESSEFFKETWIKNHRDRSIQDDLVSGDN